MVWVNDEQNSRLINFIPELLSPFALNSYRYAKKRSWKAETRVSKIALKKWNTNVCLDIATGKTRRLPFQTFHCSGICSTETNDLKSSVPFTFQADFLESFCKW